MASRRSGSDAHSNGPVNYLDDVPFKLNEKFRCPSKVGLPIGLCLPDVALRLSELQYDFSLERRSVLWGEELERAREATPTEAEPDDKQEAESACEEQELAPPALNPVLAGLRHNAILTPLPAPSLRRPPPVDPAPQSLNLADFEREEDPFDKLELKTLDDKEELRSILQSQPSPCGTPPPLKGAVLHKPNGLVGLLGVEGKSDADRPCNIRSLTFPKLSEPRDTPSGPPPTHSLSNGTPPRAGSGSSAAPPRDAQDCTQNGTKQAPGPRPTTTTILPCLSASERQCVETIVGMGYSYEGVLRAMQRQGQSVDQVLEYLFTHTRLCDQGFEAVAVEECLEMFQGSEEKALEFLQLMSRFGEMGFEKQVIKEVLLVHNNDQDRALEDLMARAAAS